MHGLNQLIDFRIQGVTIKLYSLFQNVISKGGFENVTKKRSWCRVGYEIGVPRDHQAGTVLKTKYRKLLLELEFQHWNKEKEEQIASKVENNEDIQG